MKAYFHGLFNNSTIKLIKDKISVILMIGSKSNF
jgi:hypothetical protein